MNITDRLWPGGIVDLPPESGDINASRYEPDEQWLKEAQAEYQKAALWRWFATHLEHPTTAVPHDPQGQEFLWGENEPVLADRALKDRFGDIVPKSVVQEVLAAIQHEAGNEWANKRLDKVGD